MRDESERCVTGVLRAGHRPFFNPNLWRWFCCGKDPSTDLSKTVELRVQLIWLLKVSVSWQLEKKADVAIDVVRLIQKDWGHSKGL